MSVHGSAILRILANLLAGVSPALAGVPWVGYACRQLTGGHLGLDLLQLVARHNLACEVPGGGAQRRPRQPTAAPGDPTGGTEAAPPRKRARGDEQPPSPRAPAPPSKDPLRTLNASRKPASIFAPRNREPPAPTERPARARAARAPDHAEDAPERSPSRRKRRR